MSGLTGTTGTKGDKVQIEFHSLRGIDGTALRDRFSGRNILEYVMGRGGLIGIGKQKGLGKATAPWHKAQATGDQNATVLAVVGDGMNGYFTITGAPQSNADILAAYKDAVKQPDVLKGGFMSTSRGVGAFIDDETRTYQIKDGAVVGNVTAKTGIIVLDQTVENGVPQALAFKDGKLIGAPLKSDPFVAGSWKDVFSPTGPAIENYSKVIIDASTGAQLVVLQLKDATAKLITIDSETGAVNASLEPFASDETFVGIAVDEEQNIGLLYQRTKGGIVEYTTKPESDATAELAPYITALKMSFASSGAVRA
jgi:hypothetical protein